MDSPYNTPRSDLEQAPVNGDLLARIPRFSTWYVFLLAICTLGIYIIYWAYSRTTLVNQVAGGRYRIDSGFVSSVVALYIVALLLAVGASFADQESPVQLVSSLLSLLSNILLLVWAFKFRDRINQYLQQHGRGYLRAGPVLTFFFTFLYVQYKINQIKDDQARSYMPT